MKDSADSAKLAPPAAPFLVMTPPLRFKKNPLKGGHPNVLCRWCSTHLGRAINIRAKMLREQSGAEMILFVTPIIKSCSEIITFAFETVISASPIINSVLEIIISAPDTINFGFHMTNCELDTIISGLHMVIVKPSITNCVLVAVFVAIVAVFSVTVAVLFAIVAVQVRDSSSLGRRGDNYFQLRSGHFRLEHDYFRFTDH